LQNILVYQISLKDKIDVDVIISLLENNHLEETRIIIEEKSNQDFTANYIYSEIVKQKEYDFETNSYVDITVKRYNTVSFHMDLQRSFFDVWGSKKNAQRIITAISVALNNQVTIEPCELDVNKMIGYLDQIKDISVNKVRAAGILVGNELLADCTFDLTNKN
jgi:hypothetical protein